MRHANDLIELREIAQALRRGKRWTFGGALLGLLLGAGLGVVLPPRYAGEATVLLRPSTQAIGGFKGMEGSMAALALGDPSGAFSLDNGFDTEVEILSSRTVVRAVVDSLGLQAEVLSPRGVGVESLFSAVSVPHAIKGGKYRFRREGARYSVTGPTTVAPVAPGQAAELGGAVLVLRDRGLPDEFEVRLMDHADAVEDTRKRLEVEKAAGSVASLRYHASDPRTAAAVPNAVIAHYLSRRRTTDRGVNQQRFDFLREHTDSIERELARAAAALRQHQQQSGVLSPKIQNEAEVEQAMRLRARAQELDVEVRALEQVMSSSARGHLDARRVAAYPTLLSNPAVNHLLAELSELESKKTGLLERRTPEDPDVLLVERQIDEVEGQIVGIARSFHGGVSRQRAEVERELSASRELLSALPVEVEKSFSLEREVERLAQTLTALQTQLVQARLAAITEGGDVRAVDIAEPPKRPSFPSPPFLVVLGLMGGLFFGGAGAVARGLFGARVGDVYQAERLAGVPAVRFAADRPLLLGGVEGSGAVLVIPVPAGSLALEVARQLAATASLRGEDVVLAELESATAAALPAATGAPAAETREAGAAGEMAVAPVDQDAETAERGGYRVVRASAVGGGARAVLEELEQQHALVVAALPALDHPASAAVLSSSRPAVLVMRTGKTERAELEGAVRALERLRVPLLSVVVRNGDRAD